MNTQGALIKAYAKQLKLPTLLRYEEVLRLAQDQGWGYEQFLAEILRQEILQRQENQMKRRIAYTVGTHQDSSERYLTSVFRSQTIKSYFLFPCKILRISTTFSSSRTT